MMEPANPAGALRTRPGAFLLIFLLLCTLVRLAFVATVPLLGAEAYYWEWSQHPAWGYFDHPPMVAFCISLFTRLGGDSAFVVRLTGIFLGLMTTGAFYLLARRMFGSRMAAAATGVLQVLPFFGAVSVLIVPDSPLALFWMLTLYYVYRGSVEERPLLWLAAGGALGLTLLSKYHGFLLIPCVGLYLLICPNMRFWLRRKEPYLGVGLALLVFSPNLVWNWRRGLETFHFLLVERHGAMEISPGGVLVFLGGFFLLLSPLVAVSVMHRIPGLVRRCIQDSDERYGLLLATSLPIIAFFGVLSPFVDVGAHWPAVGYAPLSLAVLAAWMENGSGRGLRSSRFARWSVSVAAILVFVAYGIPMAMATLPPQLHIGGYRLDLTGNRLYEELHGWRELGPKIRARIARMPHPQHTFIMTNSYRIASQIRLLTHSEFITRTTGYGSDHQYAVWNSEYNLAGWDALFVEKDREARYRPVLKRLFERVGPLEPVVVREDGYPVRTFYMMGCYRFRGEVGSKE